MIPSRIIKKKLRSFGWSVSLIKTLLEDIKAQQIDYTKEEWKDVNCESDAHVKMFRLTWGRTPFDSLDIIPVSLWYLVIDKQLKDVPHG